MADNAKKFVEAASGLVTLPDVYLRVKSVLEDPNSCAADMAAAIETDPATCARLLCIANSPFFGFAASVDKVARAVSLLGTVQIHDLVLATSVTNSFSNVHSPGLNIAAFWRDSVARGIGAKFIASHCNALDSERVFVAGLLSHIGEMLLAVNDPEMAESALASATNRHMPLAVVQRELLGFDYAELGAELLAAWHLPSSLEETVRWHLDPQSAENYPLETAIVHLAHTLQVDELAIEPAIQRIALGVTQLTLDDLESLKSEIDTQVDDVAALMFPLAKSA